MDAQTQALRIAKGMLSVGTSVESITTMLTSGFTDLDIKNLVIEAQGLEQKRLDHDRRWNSCLEFALGLKKAWLSPILIGSALDEQYKDLTGDERYEILAMACGEKPIPETFAPREEVKGFDPKAFKPIRERGYTPPTHLVDGLIMLHGINVFVGDFGSGKSISNLDMLRSMANGTRWAGRETKASRPVWILDRENPEYYLLMIADLLDIQDGDLHLFKHEFQWLTERDYKFSGVDDPRLLAAVEACEPGAEPVIVFDSFRAWLCGDENSAVDVRAHWNKCRELTSRRATVVTLHHNNKLGGFSGSTDVGAGTDVFWSVESIDKPKLGTLIFKPLRVRGVADAEFSVKFNEKSHRFESVVTPNNKSEEDRHGKLGDLLINNGGLTKSGFANLAALRHVASRDQARAYIDTGLLGGWVENRGSQEKTKLFSKQPSGGKVYQMPNRMTDDDRAASGEDGPF